MLKQVKWSSVLSSAAFIIVGVLMIIYPNVSASVVAYIIGIGFAVFGVVNIAAYFMLDIQDTLYRNDFVIGLMALIFGIAVILKQDMIANLIPLILGLIIMSSGFAKLQRAIISKRIGYSDSRIYIILALISIIFGIVVMFFLNGESMASILFIVIGAGLIYCGASDLFANFFLASKFNQFVKQYKAAKDKVQGKVIDAETENEETSDDTDASDK
ncbi:MAG: DUF308 domain-containing protein [Solobacterium sp.]|jgi:uncharacterized membrane protein HdeD (DUF308 family)|nr:DUF308 domain-containing protein [Solobacterium sp.]MCH4205756.1 DUF308 domain-containing protein [Solobacterium sp.]MCH4227280.1 DUF308 domain-containing protein [Solobacterium sp.]